MTPQTPPPKDNRVAAVAEIRDLARFHISDRMGGRFGVLLAVGLVALVVLVDAFALGWLADLMGRRFQTSCAAPAVAAAGGYGWMLLGVLGLAMGLLHLVSRRGIGVSLWLLAFTPCVPLLLMTAVHDPMAPGPASYVFNLAEILTALEDRTAALPLGASPVPVPGLTLLAQGAMAWLDVPLGLTCPDGSTVSALDRLHDRYTSGDRLTGAMPSHVMSSSMMLNLVLAVVALPLILVLAAVHAGVRRFLLPESLRKPWQPRGAEGTLVIWLAIAALVLVLAMPPLAALMPNPGPLSRALENLIWIGPLMLVLDMARVCLFSPAPAATADAAQTDTAERDAAPQFVLPEALKGIRADLPDPVLDVITLDPLDGAPRAEALPPPSLPGTAGLVFFEQALTPALMAGMARDLASQVLDPGGSVLVICPAEAETTVGNRLQAALMQMEGNTQLGLLNRPRPQANAPDAHRIGDLRTASDIIVTAPEGLEELLRDGDGFKHFLTRLGGVVIVHAHAMDLGMVRASFNRLGTMVAAPDRLQVFVQSEFRHGLHDDTIGRLPMLLGIEHREIRTGANADLHRPHHLVLIEAQAPEGKPPTWLRAMVAARRKAPAAAIAVIDHDFRLALKPLIGLVEHDLRVTGQSDLANWVKELPVAQIAPPEGRSPLALLEDRGNLADALTASLAEEHAHEAMTVVTVGGYPTSRFLQGRLRQALPAPGSARTRGAPAKRQALKAFRDTYGSIMPSPADGPAELALMTVRDLDIARRQQGWVGQDRLRALWGRANPWVLRQLRVNVAAPGLRRLLALGASSALQGHEVEQGRDGATARRFRLRIAAPPGALALDMLRISVDQARERFLPFADHGLSYALGTRLVNNGIGYKVTGVNQNTRQVSLEVSNQTRVPRMDFVRDYASAVFHRPDAEFAAEGFAQEINVAQPFASALGYVPFERHTRAVLEWAQDAAPFAQGAAPRRIECNNVHSPHRLRRVACVALLADPQGAGAPQRPQPMVPATVAFTLAMTLQDVVSTLFPPHAHRLAVLPTLLPGEAGGLPSPGPGPQDRVLRYALERMPRLVTMPGQPSQPPGGPAGASAAFVSRFLQQARDGMAGAAPPPKTRLGLMLVEDSDHDLGVARAFAARFTKQVLPFWVDYLDWCCKQDPGSGTHPYAFGTKELPDLFRFSEAHEIASAMR